ncbi:aldo/keto reductase [Umezawaea tangerina]|uniref:Aryl-alcohol dehydrogenase-like predicted oxidoreductase n=1 Tax=Umezawaea tangerina TaxID=84725 RepID=A0A2T0SLF6_9PSEU|nr:aldo/keto reductase [Umezawaea tangerina]PRY34247.1 aryl-alcohol dehydrogenase-like predicted oxidoreductase [Umezawaea tangerina]
MEQLRLGGSGLAVSRIVLGCMGYGDPARGTHPWSLGIDDARPLVKQALDAGVTTFDTANSYSIGSSEEIVGKLLGELADRSDVVIATKVYGRMAEGPNGAGLSRGAIMTQVDASLRRLGTDYIDLYQIHRYDPKTPITETMEALHDLVRAGKVRYLGASSMWTWQFAQMQHAADLNGWTRFVAMQDQYNLIMREEEREMHPYCLDEGVGVLPWSPLARGRLTRDWGATTERSETDAFGGTLYKQTEETDRKVVDAVAAVAAERGVPRARVALAWMLHKPAVTAPIVGVTKPHHLTDAVASVDLELSDDEIRLLEEHYVPHAAEAF